MFINKLFDMFRQPPLEPIIDLKYDDSWSIHSNLYNQNNPAYISEQYNETYSHAEGVNTIVSGSISHAEGVNTKAVS